MVESYRKNALITVGLGAFHATCFMLVIVIIAYASGTLGLYLSGLNTSLGIGLFLLLWGVTTYCTRRAVQEIPWETTGQPMPLANICGVGWKWGGRNGIIFASSLIVLTTLGFLINEVVFGDFGEGLSILSIPLSGLVGLAVAAVPSFFIGGLIGLIFSCIDKTLLKISRFFFALWLKEGDHSVQQF